MKVRKLKYILIYIWKVLFEQGKWSLKFIFLNYGSNKLKYP